MYFPTVFVKVKKEKINWARKLMEKRIARKKIKKGEKNTYNLIADSETGNEVGC